jgi:L,D-transpeptidase-like protein
VGGSLVRGTSSQGRRADPCCVSRFLLRAAASAVAFAALAPSAAARVSLAGGDGWTNTPAESTPVHVIVHVRSGVALHSRPFGPTVSEVGATTPFGSPRALGVVTTRRGRWLAVTDPRLGNGHVGWIDARAGGLSYSRTALEVDVDLSQRTLVLRRADTVLRRATVGVGRPGSPTPTGRFAVTDKLSGPAFSLYYGCCILALSATQPDLPAGWSGGNRIAIHGTPSSSDFGRAVSAGCIHARDEDLRYLMRSVPLGTPVVIRR